MKNQTYFHILKLMKALILFLVIINGLSRYHMDLKHNMNKKVESILCPNCGDIFTSKIKLQIHITAKHRIKVKKHRIYTFFKPRVGGLYTGGAEGKNENLDSKKQVLWFSYFLQWSFFSIQRIKPKKLMRASVPNFIIQIRIFSKKWQKIFFL